MSRQNQAGISEKAGTVIPTPVYSAPLKTMLLDLARKPLALSQSNFQLRILPPADPWPATLRHIPQTIKEELRFQGTDRTDAF